MSSSSSSPSVPYSQLPFWRRWLARFLGWCSLSPWPPSPQSSGTLETDDEVPVIVSKELAHAINALESVAGSLISGETRAVVVFQQSPSEVAVMWYTTGDNDPGKLAVEMMDYGRRLMRQAARLQGTAPPNNRSGLVH